MFTWAWAAGGDADQRAGEPIEHEDDGADEADGGGQPQVELVVHVGSLEAVSLPAHDGGDVDDVQHRHVEQLFFCLCWGWCGLIGGECVLSYEEGQVMLGRVRVVP